MPEAPNSAHQTLSGRTTDPSSDWTPATETVSLRHLLAVISLRRRFVAFVIGGSLTLCLLYCLIAPRQYDATARVSLRVGAASSLNPESAETVSQASILSSPLQLETLANVFRSDRLAWRVITELKLSQNPAFSHDFQRRFPDFNPASPRPEPQQYLIERFHRRLLVQSIPRTLLLKIRFRSKDPALAAKVVNTLVADYGLQEMESRVEATAQASRWLSSQIEELKTRVDDEQKRLTRFQQQHGLLSKTEDLPNGQQSVTIRNPALLEIDELERQLVAASSDRILAEALYRATRQGNPEQVLAGNPQLQITSGLSTGILVQLHARHSDLEQEQAQLSAEHGPNFPRVVEIQRQLADIDRQVNVEDDRLMRRFESTWKTATDREQLVRRNLEERTRVGMEQNQAAAQYQLMQMEFRTNSELLMRATSHLEEGGMSAGVHAPSITVVDPALQPVKAVAPNPPLYFAITFFVSLWLALGGVLLLESLPLGTTLPPGASKSHARSTLALFIFAVLGLLWSSTPQAYSQAPTPSTSGIPTGVARPVLSPTDPRPPVDRNQAPVVWDNPFGGSPAATTSLPSSARSTSAAMGMPMSAPIGPGDVLDISEFHTPEFHSRAHVAANGTVTLPMVQEVVLLGLDEQSAAQAIEKAFVDRGLLLHPHVSVLVVESAGQDVSVLGEVARPGVYPYTVHHRLLDLISAAAGLSPTAGRLVNIYHRGDPHTAHPVALDPSGSDNKQDHNPELEPGDTIQISRAGLVYVIGDVVRPGGFPVDPVQGLTVVQALSLAWGPSQNAATGKAILIREQKGGRTLTTVNLGRMLHGKDPDLPIRDRDILFVPDSRARALLNRSIDAAIQSAIGVSIYSGMVYSQRY